MDVKAKLVIDLLTSGPTFDKTKFAETLANNMYNEGPLAPLKKYAPQNTYNEGMADGFFGKYLKERSQMKWNLDNLAGGTLGLAFKQEPDQWGFSESTNAAQAKSTVETSLIRLIPHLVEAHVDSLLDTKGIEHLSQLANNKEFVDAYTRQLKSKDVTTALTTAKNTSMAYGRSFRGTLIYVYEYFQQKVTPYIHGKLAAAGSADGTFSDIVHAWLQSNTSPSQQQTFSQVFNQILDNEENDPHTVLKDPQQFAHEVLSTIMPLEILYVPALDLGQTVPYIAHSVLERVTKLGVDSRFAKFVLSAIPQEMVSFAQELQVEWSLHISKLATMVKASNASCEEKEESGTDSDAFGVVNFPTHWIDQYYGQENAQCTVNLGYLNIWSAVEFQGRSGLPSDVWWGSTKNELRIRRKEGSFRRDKFDGGGCFRAGTLVQTKKGEKVIEDLQEHDAVLTRADTQEYGVRSDEPVFFDIPGGEVVLYGFNGEECFFTANHVFYTTSGLRALDPEAAVAENPWVQVGRLRVGHVLLHTTDGRTYNHVPIQSIESATSACNRVYGVHLREGLRSYHANGYRVHLNYPEITMKTIVKLLLTFPAQQRIQLLKSISDLQPLFARFGAGTLTEVLNVELAADEQKLSKMQEEVPIPQKVLPLYFQHRTFSLSAQSGPHDPTYWFPDVTACDGILYIDDLPCYTAQITERGFLWSRQRELDTTPFWEYGFCSFGEDPNMLSGNGAVYIEVDSSRSKPFPFVANSTRYCEPGVYYLMNPEVAKMRLSEDVDHASAVVMVESNVNKIPSMVDNKAAEDQWKEKMQKMTGEAPRKSVNLKAEPLEFYSLHYRPYIIGEAPDGEPDVPLGTVRLLTSGTQNGVQQNQFDFPDLDAIGHLLWQKARIVAPNTEFTPIYDCSVVEVKSNMTVTITLKDPHGLAIEADDNVVDHTDNTTVADAAEPKAKSYENLTFKNLGSDFKLRHLFSKFTFSLNPQLGQLEGKMAVFDPEYTADNGEMHALYGEEAPKATPASPSEFPSPPSEPNKGLPDWLKRLANKPTGLNLHSLATSLGVDTQKLKEDTQQLIFKTMLYHLSPSDRKVLGYNEPPEVSDTNTLTAIPSAAANGLDEALRDWIRDTYGPAYILQNFANASFTDQQLIDNFGIKFGQKLKKKLDYFWRGSGAKCLSRSREYDRLNHTLTMIAFRRRYPRIQDYLQDMRPITTEGDDRETDDQTLKGFAGGKKWAHLLYEDLIQEHWVKRIAEQSIATEITKLNLLETYCTILQALWHDSDEKDAKQAAAEKTLPERLALATKTYAQKKQFFRFRSISDPKVDEANLRDYLYELFLILWDPEAAKKTGLNQKFIEEFQREIASNENWNKELMERSKEEKAKATLGMWSGLVSTSASLGGAIGILANGRDGAKGMSKIDNFVRGLFTGRPRSPDAPPKPSEPLKGGKLKLAVASAAVLTLAMTAIYVYNSWDQWGQWASDEDGKTFSDLAKGNLVTSSLQVLGNVVLSSYKLHQALSVSMTGALATQERIIELAPTFAPPVQIGNVDEAAELRNTTQVLENANDPGVRKLSNPQDIELPEPVRLKDRIEAGWNRVKQSAKTRLRNFWQKAKTPKLQYSIPEAYMRGFLVLLSFVLIVLSAIAAYRLLQDPTATGIEKFLAIWNIFIQVLSLILDILCFMYAIPCYVGIAIVLIGAIVAFIVSKIMGEPKPPKQPMQSWWEEKGEEFFKERIPEIPELRLKYSVTPAEAAPMSDQTLVIRGKRGTSDNGLQRLSRIAIRFTSHKSDATALFQASGTFQKAARSSDLLPQQQGRYAMPSHLQGRLNYDIAENSVSAIRTWDAIFAVKSQQELGLKHEDPVAVMDFNDTDEIVFTVRGVIADAIQPKDAKTPEKGDVPQWRKCQIRITEAYVEEDGSPGDILEEVLDFTKALPKEKN